MYLQLTLLTHGHLLPYLCPGAWVLTSGSFQIGLKWFVNLWDTYWVPGPGSGPQVQSYFYASWFLGPRSWNPDPDCGLTPKVRGRKILGMKLRGWKCGDENAGDEKSGDENVGMKKRGWKCRNEKSGDEKNGDENAGMKCHSAALNSTKIFRHHT